MKTGRKSPYFRGVLAFQGVNYPEGICLTPAVVSMSHGYDSQVSLYLHTWPSGLRCVLAS
jgi:hypothetical protein